MVELSPGLDDEGSAPLRDERLSEAEQDLEDLGAVLAGDLPPPVRARVEGWRRDAQERVARLTPP